ncbi:hypothetical protein Pmani_001045 [Petrolisthes manimaculis]|uniref:Uncharacterized protein n=1 Tax=Petrolisthes manimaculis TaxID=1843537 RepID=A0AAE1QKH7_9EUCA|nr:hypothetical protein Pmani_001045 [Petrolisthes manimaculis]
MSVLVSPSHQLATVPPRRLRRDQLALNTAMSTIRKSEIGNVANASLHNITTFTTEDGGHWLYASTSWQNSLM